MVAERKEYLKDNCKTMKSACTFSDIPENSGFSTDNEQGVFEHTVTALACNNSILLEYDGYPTRQPYKTHYVPRF